MLSRMDIRERCIIIQPSSDNIFMCARKHVVREIKSTSLSIAIYVWNNRINPLLEYN